MCLQTNTSRSSRQQQAASNERLTLSESIHPFRCVQFASETGSHGRFRNITCFVSYSPSFAHRLDFAAAHSSLSPSLIHSLFFASFRSILECYRTISSPLTFRAQTWRPSFVRNSRDTFAFFRNTLDLEDSDLAITSTIPLLVLAASDNLALSRSHRSEPTHIDCLGCAARKTFGTIRPPS